MNAQSAATTSDTQANSRWKTPLTEALGCRYPIVQTAMGWVSDANLVIATTRAGGFGFLAGATIASDDIEAEICQALAPCEVFIHHDPQSVVQS